MPVETRGWAVSGQPSAKPKKAGVSRPTFLYCLFLLLLMPTVCTHSWLQIAGHSAEQEATSYTSTGPLKWAGQENRMAICMGNVQVETS